MFALFALFVTAAVSEPHPPPAPPVPYYETDALFTTVSAATARRRLGQELQKAGLSLSLERADGVRIPIRPSSRSLGDPVVAAALTPFVHRRPGAELDLVAERTDASLLLVTLRWDPEELVISQARAPRGRSCSGISRPPGTGTGSSGRA